jgi:hypothetical protein
MKVFEFYPASLFSQGATFRDYLCVPKRWTDQTTKLGVNPKIFIQHVKSGESLQSHIKLSVLHFSPFLSLDYFFKLKFKYYTEDPVLSCPQFMFLPRSARVNICSYRNKRYACSVLADDVVPSV